MKTFLQKSILFIAAIMIAAVSNTATASHYTGAEIQYKCVGTNKYIFTLVVIRDCQGADMFNVDDLILTNTCTGKEVTLWCNAPSKNGFTPDAIEISQLCPGQKSACSGGSQPGFEKVFYHSDTVTITSSMIAYCCGSNGLRDTVKLTTACDNWKVAWRSGIQDRNSTVNTTGGKMYAEITFNNQLIPNSNSPAFTSRPIPFVCVNQPVNYSYGVIASDVAVKLKYSLIGARGFDVNSPNWNVINLTYANGYSAISPIPGITIDSITGQVNFTPTTVGKFVVVVQVKEYDSKGNWVATIMRDMEFVVQSCTNKNPNIAPAGSIRNLKNISGTTFLRDSFALETYTGNSFSFDVVFTDPNVGDSLRILSNIDSVFPGATIKTSGSNPMTATVSCTVPAKNSGKNNLFVIAVHDNACPIFGEQVFAYSVNVLEKTSASADKKICISQTVQLSAVGGSVFTWKTLSGDTIQVGKNFSCNPCANPIASPSKTTVYEVTSNLSAGMNKDTITVTVNSLPTKPSITQNKDTLTSSIANSYQWNLNKQPITGAVAQVFVAKVTGTYSVVVTDANGCSNTSDSLNVIIAGIEEQTKNISVTISPNPTNGRFTITMAVGRWKMADGKITIYNVLGKVVFQTTSNPEEKSGLHSVQQSTIINLSALPAGIYFLQVNTGEEIINRKLVLEK